MNDSLSFLTLNHSIYELIPRASLGSIASPGSRKGALLRIQFQDEKIGYADCHPWPELGDIPLSSQLSLLKNRHTTNLTQRSLYYARMDADARATHSSLWKSIGPVPLSHGLVVDTQSLTSESLEGLASQGFTHIKIKVGSRPLKEARLLASLSHIFQRKSLKIRLDFNSSLSWIELEAFIHEIGSIREWIDFIEDPTPYDAELWTKIHRRWGLRLALDRMSEKIRASCVRGSFSVLVLKPAIQDPESMLRLAEEFQVPLVLTSYLDHPFGQYCAAWTAAQLSARHPIKIETCGLLSQTAYEAQCFLNWIDSQGPRLSIPQGHGFGMDYALAQLPWSRL